MNMTLIHLHSIGDWHISNVCGRNAKRPGQKCSLGVGGLLNMTLVYINEFEVTIATK